MVLAKNRLGCCSRRHFSSHRATSPQSQILRFCILGSLHQALDLLNAANSSASVSAKPNVYASLLQTCIRSNSFSHGLQIHSYVLKSGLVSDRYVGNSLLSLYFKLCPTFTQTRLVFDDLHVRDVISWTSMVSGYVRAGRPQDAIQMFGEMLDSGVEPNAFTLSSVIKACSEMEALLIGRCFHGIVLIRGLNSSNHVVASALVDMYGRNLEAESARKVFDEMLQPDAICWTSLISSLTRCDRFEEALKCFFSMQKDHSLSADDFTFGTVLTACGNLGRLKQGKEVHAKVIVTPGMGSNVVVESSLVDMYGKCRTVSDSRRVFDRMAVKNSVTRCALLGGYCQNGDFEAVLELFREMEKGGELHYSFGTVLRACGGLAAVRNGKEVHCQYLRTAGWRNVIIDSALVDLYAKCGCIDYAFRIFSNAHIRNLITWNSMIGGLAQNGRGEESLAVFKEMLKEGIKPDYISFIGVLFACSHRGLVEDGKEHFRSMGEEYGITAGMEHYSCMVDLLGRAGLLEEAEDLIKGSDFWEDSSLWASLLGACTAHSNMGVAERVAKKMMELQPDYHLSYVLLANLYRARGRWEDALKIRELMERRRIKKTPGKSWLEIANPSYSYFHGTDTVDMSKEPNCLGISRLGLDFDPGVEFEQKGNEMGIF